MMMVCKALRWFIYWNYYFFYQLLQRREQRFPFDFEIERVLTNFVRVDTSNFVLLLWSLCVIDVRGTSVCKTYVSGKRHFYLRSPMAYGIVVII